MAPVFEFIGLVVRFLTLLVLLVLVILIEAIVLGQFKYGSFWRSLLASSLINVTSTVMGFAIGASLNLLNSLLAYLDRPIGSADIVRRWFLPADSGLFSNSRLPSMPLFLLISWMISVISEGWMLTLMKRDVESHRIWEMTLVANAASYVLLFSIYIVVIWNL